MQCGRPVIFLVLTLVASVALRAQVTIAREEQSEYLFFHLDYTNGLLSNELFSFAQDGKGYMWIGTRKGLQRYDGLRFVNFTDTAPEGAENFTIASLYPDDVHHRILYNQSNSSLKAWQLLNNRLITLMPGQEFKPDAGTSYRDHFGRNWLLQVFTAAQRGKEGIAILKEPGKEPYFVDFFKSRQKGQIWVVGPGLGVLVFDDSTHAVSSPADPGSNALLRLLNAGTTSIRKIVADSHGNTWLATWSPFFYRYNTLTGKLFTYSLQDILRQQGNDPKKSGWVTSILEDDHGKVWVGTAYTGLLKYDPVSDAFSYIVHQPGDDQTIQYNTEIETLFQDRESTIWVGTDKGISLFNPYRQYFSAFARRKHGLSPIPDEEVNAAMETLRGDVLVGYWGNGISVYDGNLRYKKNFSFPDTRDKNLIWCFLNNSDGSVWAGCQHGYLHLIDAAANAVRTIHPVEMENSTIRCMERDTRGNILMGLHNGKIVVLDKQSGQFIPFNLQGQRSSLPLSSVVNIFVDKQDRCWAATENGLCEYDPTRRCYRAVYKPSTAAPAYCSGIAEYDDSLLLVGIQEAGMFFFNRKSRTFSKLGAATEQPILSAYAVRKDSIGNFWFTTDYDVCRYDPVSKKLLTYHPGKALVSSSFSPTRFAVLRSGKWLALTDDEIVLFSPEEVDAAGIGDAKATITGFKVFDKPLFVDSFLHRRTPVPLSYKENFISIEYSDMQFSGATRTNYYYRLSGVDKDWVVAGSRGYASYTNLAPGKYQFQVRAEGAGDIGSIASLDIVIVPPFWGTIWFRLACLLLSGGALYMLIRRRIRHIRHDADMQQQIATTEMMALRAQMNPHFIFNCINSIDALIQSNDKYQATMYLNKFARLIRNILDSSRQNSISLMKDLETLRLYIELEQVRHENKFIAEIHTDEDVAGNDYKVPPLIIQPYVENAILHGLRNRTDDRGRLIIGITRQNGHLLCVIEDNGVGREASKKLGRRSSYGMEMSSDRVRLFNRQEQAPVTVTDLHDEGRASGTRVEVLLKIQ